MGGNFLLPEQLKQQTRERAAELQRLAAWRLEWLALAALLWDPLTHFPAVYARALQAAHAYAPT